MNYQRKQPCNNCPYRTDAPLQHWSKDEFKDLLAHDKSYMGANYGCHKADGHVCVGFLMDQDKRHFPSIKLRISLSSNKVTRAYLDALFCKVPLYKNIPEMIKANYPTLIK